MWDGNEKNHVNVGSCLGDKVLIFYVEQLWWSDCWRCDMIFFLTQMLFKADVKHFETFHQLVHKPRLTHEVFLPALALIYPALCVFSSVSSFCADQCTESVCFNQFNQPIVLTPIHRHYPLILPIQCACRETYPIIEHEGSFTAI